MKLSLKLLSTLLFSFFMAVLIPASANALVIGSSDTLVSKKSAPIIFILLAAQKLDQNNFTMDFPVKDSDAMKLIKALLGDPKAPVYGDKTSASSMLNLANFDEIEAVKLTCKQHEASNADNTHQISCDFELISTKPADNQVEQVNNGSNSNNNANNKSHTHVRSRSNFNF